MLNLVDITTQISTLSWIVIASLLGGALSVSLAAIFALNVRTTWVPMLVSYAIGAMLGAVFLEILPHAFSVAGSVERVSATLLLGLLLFFVLEKLVIWRHCHGDHCEVHALHTEENCPVSETEGNTKYKAANQKPSLNLHRHHHGHSHEHDGGRSRRYFP